jgi:peroxiredoxin
VTELGELREHYGEILERGVEVVAVSVDPPETSERLRRRLALEIRFVSDPEGTLMDPLGIRHRGGRPPFGAPAGASRDIFLPTTFLVDVDAGAGGAGAGVVRWVYRPHSYRVRATPQEVLAALDAAR